MVIYTITKNLSRESYRKDSLFVTCSLFGLLLRDMGLALAPPHSLCRSHCRGKKSPSRHLSIILLVKKLTTLLKSTGSIFPQTFATPKLFRVTPASSAMSFMVYLYSTFGLYGYFDPLLGILTSYRSPFIGEGFINVT
jgi:hypothetical protein